MKRVDPCLRTVHSYFYIYLKLHDSITLEVLEESLHLLFAEFIGTGYEDLIELGRPLVINSLFDLVVDRHWLSQ